MDEKKFRRTLKLVLVVVFAGLVAGLLIIFGVAFTSYAAEDNGAKSGEDTAYIDVEAQEDIIQEGGFPDEENIYYDSPEAEKEYGFDAEGVADKIKAAWYAGEDSVDIEEFIIDLRDNDDLVDLYTDLINDNPDYFFLDKDLRFEYNPRTDDILSIKFKYSVEDKSTRMNMIKDYNAAIETFMKGVNSAWTDMEKFIYIHDYLARNCEYDTAKTMEHRYDTYGVFVDQKAVCQGYALAVNTLASKLGLESYYVSSEEMNHGWNMVKINGKFYMMDVTWDDTDRLGRVDHWYMFKSMSFFKSGEGSHIADDYVVKGEVLPEDANDTKYDSYKLFNDIKISFEYIDGKWYGLYGGDISIHTLTCDGTDWEVGDKLVDLYDARWYDEDGGYFLADLGAGYTTYDNILYYSLADSIYTYDPKENKSEKVYELSEDEKKLGNILGLYKTEDNKLQYQLAKNLDIEDGTIKTIDLPEGNMDNGRPTAIISIDGNINHGMKEPGNVVYTNSAECKLTGIDDTGIRSMSYFVAGREYSEEELKISDESIWTTQEGKQVIFEINSGEEGEYFVYGRAIDTSGNAGYASLGKVIVDKKAPIIYFIGSNTDDKNVADVYVYDDYLDKVYVNGIEADHKEEDGILTITASDKPYEIKVVDKAKNEKVETINFNSEEPEDSKEPKNPEKQETSKKSEDSESGVIHGEINDSEQSVQEGGLLDNEDAYYDASNDRIENRYNFDADRLMRKIQSAWDKEAVGVDISEFKVNKRDINDLREVYKTYINQNPEYFYISSTFDYFFYEGENNIFKINFDYRVKDKSAIKKMIKEYNASIERFKKSVNPSWSEMEKFVYIHDYLATHCEYDTSKEREHCHDAYGALVEKIAVCQGYALAVNELAESLGLESHFVTSQSMHHGWNMVKVNGKYYMMDVTWDDPTPDKVGRVRHKYLLKSMPWFNSGKGNHMTSDYIVQADILPSIANDRKYDDYILDRINVGLQYVNGTWYGLYYPDSSIYSFICDGSDWKFGDKIVNLKYSNWNADGVFYDAEVAGGLTSYKNKLYYSCIDGIYTYDFKTKKSIKVYDIPSKEKNKGVIIGIVRTEDNKMKYLLSSERSGKNGTVKIIDIP